MIKIPLNWSLPISAHHITQGIVVACAVLYGTAINPNVYGMWIAIEKSLVKRTPERVIHTGVQH